MIARDLPFESHVRDVTDKQSAHSQERTLVFG